MVWIDPLWCDFSTAEAMAPGTTAAPADNAAVMATVMEAEAATAVSEELLAQAAMHQPAEGKTSDAPVAPSELSPTTELTAR